MSEHSAPGVGLTDDEYEVVAQAFVSANRAEYEPLDHDAAIDAAFGGLLASARAESWDAAMEAVRARIFASYSHGDERGEAWVPFVADLLRNLRSQPIPNPHRSTSTRQDQP